MRSEPGEPRRHGHVTALAIVLVVLLVITFAAGGYGLKRGHDQASAHERVALARRLALSAAELRDDDLVRARNLGLAAVKIHPDEQTRAGLTDTLLSWRRKDLYSLDPRGAGSVALSGDGKAALIGDAGGVGLWSLKTWLDPEVPLSEKADPVHLAKRPHGDVVALALSFDGRTALTADGDGTTDVWDLTDPVRPGRLATMPGGAKNDDEVEALALTRDGRLAVAGDFGGNLIVWDLSDRSRPVRLSSIKAHESSVRDVRLSADGRTVVTGGDDHDVDQKVTIWDLAVPTRPVRLSDLDLPGRAAESTAMSADGRTIVVANPDRADVWKVDDRAHPVHTAMLSLPPIDIHDVALTPNGKTALLAGASGTGFLWDLSDPSRPARLAALKGYTQEVSSVALSADGRVALMTSPDRGVSLWDLSDLAAIVSVPEEFLCSTFDWKISKADWDRYSGGAEWPDPDADPDSLSLCSIP
ncbi:WD40 repeat domain-containing protein [Nonomuraea sp. KM90]|uniref:WD40 repeat domain-containing protein n=1 Tax=Nonomuraea sp. KM90 TaxID=3457428 RepID=UPI003FCCCE12